jgi:hypothetical protein
VAAIAQRASTDRDAKASLLRPVLRDRALGLGSKAAFRRRNELFKRQGEWSFAATSPDLMPGHTTLVLGGWHQVFLNGEIVSGNVSFYD